MTSLKTHFTVSSNFNPGLGGSVYFSWPDPNAPQSWQYLGYISNDKPSAVFKVRNFKIEPSPFSHPTPGFGFNQTAVSHVAQIGISIDPLIDIKDMTPCISLSNDHMATFATKTAENLFNFVSSFSKNVPGTNEQVVPLTVVQTWYQNYLKKIEMNPNFLKN